LLRMKGRLLADVEVVVQLDGGALQNRGEFSI
jgi:hypothetical protein